MFNRNVNALLAAALVAGLSTSAQAERENPDEIIFGIIGTENRTVMREKLQPFVDDMTEQMSRPVELFFASDYAGIIEAMRFDQVDLAWFGNLSATVAVERAGAEIFAQEVGVDGDPGYWSLMVTHKDSGLTYDDVMACDGDLDFGLGDPNSTSGFLVPSTFIFAAEGVTPEECFGTVRNAGHETNLISVATEQVDAAVVSSAGLYKRLKVQKPEYFAEIEEIWRSPLIASDPLAYRAELDPAVKAEIAYFFLSYGRHGSDAEVAEARANLEKMDVAPFQPSSNAQTWPFQEMELIREKLSIENDDTYSDAEKAERIAEIEADLETVRAAAAARPRM